MDRHNPVAHVSGRSQNTTTDGLPHGVDEADVVRHPPSLPILLLFSAFIRFHLGLTIQAK